MKAIYKGSTEHYTKHRKYKPMTIRYGETYDIAIDTYDRMDWVSIIEDGFVRTQIPYSKGNVEKYWKLDKKRRRKYV